MTVFVCHHICYRILSGGGKKLVVSTRLIWRFFRSHNLLRQINLREEARSCGEGRMMLGEVASQRDVGGGGAIGVSTFGHCHTLSLRFQDASGYREMFRQPDETIPTEMI